MINSTVSKVALSACFALAITSTIESADADQIPRPSASYFGKAQMIDGKEKLSDIEVRANGSKIRYDMPASFTDESYPVAMILDYELSQMTMFPVGDSVSPDERMAMQMSMESGGPEDGYNPTMPDLGTKVGTGTYAGETCSKFEVTSVGASGAIETQQACLTSDGILLHSRDDVDGQVSFEMTELRRGAQPDALFAVPAGYQVVDMSTFGGAMAMAMGDDEASPFGDIVDGAMDEAKDETTRQTRNEVRGLVRGLFGN